MKHGDYFPSGGRQNNLERLVVKWTPASLASTKVDSIPVFLPSGGRLKCRGSLRARKVNVARNRRGGKRRGPKDSELKFRVISEVIIRLNYRLGLRLCFHGTCSAGKSFGGGSMFNLWVSCAFMQRNAFKSKDYSGRSSDILMRWAIKALCLGALQQAARGAQEFLGIPSTSKYAPQTFQEQSLLGGGLWNEHPEDLRTAFSIYGFRRGL